MGHWLDTCAHTRVHSSTRVHVCICMSRSGAGHETGGDKGQALAYLASTVPYDLTVVSAAVVEGPDPSSAPQARDPAVGKAQAWTQRRGTEAPRPQHPTALQPRAHLPLMRLRELTPSVSVSVCMHQGLGGRRSCTFSPPCPYT